MNRNRWSAALMALLLFFGGVAVGALGDRYYHETSVKARSSHADFRQRYLHEMQSRLNLSAAQVKQLESVMDETGSKIRAVKESQRPEMDRIRAQHVENVKAILSPQQVSLYDQLIAERERKEKDHESH